MVTSVPTTKSGRQSAPRCGRPPRERAGEVDERILEAAGRVFLERGFEGASIDEIAEVARAGKPTIYARFPGKEALFAALITCRIRRNTDVEGLATTGNTIEERLMSVAMSLLRKVLTPESIGLIRIAIAEARRFPDLAASVHKMARERGAEAVAHVLGELAQSEKMSALPAFAADRIADTAQRFRDLILLPMLMRALFAEDLAALNAESQTHVAHSVAFFLAACKGGEAAKT